MATATKKVQVARSPAAGAGRAPDRASLGYVISQENGGDYRWEIVDSGGEALVHSAGFATRDDAVRAALYVHDSARLAHFGPREPEQSQIVAL